MVVFNKNCEGCFYMEYQGMDTPCGGCITNSEYIVKKSGEKHCINCFYREHNDKCFDPCAHCRDLYYWKKIKVKKECRNCMHGDVYFSKNPCLSCDEETFNLWEICKDSTGKLKTWSKEVIENKKSKYEKEIIVNPGPYNDMSKAPKNHISEDKHDMSELPLDLLAELLCPAYKEGSLKKYYRNSWRKGFKMTVMFAACLRHLSKFFFKREVYDQETLEKYGIKKHHLGAAMFCIISLYNDFKYHPHNDDRPPVKEEITDKRSSHHG